MRALCLVMLAGCGFSKTVSTSDLATSDLASEDLALADLSSADFAAAAADLATPPLRVFVTSGTYLGWINNSIHGVLEGDLECTQLAGPLGGTWRAWLSDSSVLARDRVLGPGPWVRLDGKVAFAGRPTTPPTEPVNLDQHGQTVEFNARVWTGTESGGGTTTFISCMDWSSTDFMLAGAYGNADSLIDAWTSTATQPCNSFAHLYCFEQSN